MKKLLIILVFSLFIVPFAKADMLFGFTDGAGLYNSEGVQLYTCFQDQTCVGLDNVVHTRAELGVGPVPVTSAPTTSPSVPNQITVYVPVYTTPTNTPAPVTSTSTPIVGGEPQATSTPTSTPPDINIFLGAVSPINSPRKTTEGDYTIATFGTRLNKDYNSPIFITEWDFTASSTSPNLIKDISLVGHTIPNINNNFIITSNHNENWGVSHDYQVTADFNFSQNATFQLVLTGIKWKSDDGQSGALNLNVPSNILTFKQSIFVHY